MLMEGSFGCRLAGTRSGEGRGRAVGTVHPAGDDTVGDLGDLEVGDTTATRGGDHLHDREDPPGQVGSTGGGVVVRGVVQRLHDGGHALTFGEVLAVELLQRAAGEQRAGPHRVERRLLVAAAGDVVAEDATLTGRQVVAGEE